MKEGKKPMTDEELKSKLDNERNSKYEEAKHRYESI
jgi:hypothetical protein